MSLSSRDLDTYSKIHKYLPYDSIMSHFRTDSLGDGFAESTIKPIHDIIFEFENNPNFFFDNNTLKKLCKDLYDTARKLVNYLSTNTMLESNGAYRIPRPWDMGHYSYDRTAEERFQKIIDVFNQTISEDFIKAYDDLTKKFYELDTTTKKVVPSKIREINNPMLFVALKRISNTLIKEIWPLCIGADKETEATFDLAKAKSEKYKKDIEVLAAANLSLNWDTSVEEINGLKVYKNINKDYNPWYQGDVTLETLMRSLSDMVEFFDNGDDYIEYAEFLHYYYWVENEFLQSNKRPENIDSNINYYVDKERLTELQLIKSPKYDLKRLIRYCEELNYAYNGESYFSTAMLLRAVIDHIPPIFGYKYFREVVANSNKSLKDSLKRLEESSRPIGDSHLHTTIRKKEVLPTVTQVNFKNDLDVLLGEIVRILS